MYTLSAFLNGTIINVVFKPFSNYIVCPGVEGFTSTEDQEMISRIEKQMKRRFAIGSQVSEHSIVGDFTKQVSVTQSEEGIRCSPINRFKPSFIFIYRIFRTIRRTGL